MKRKSRTEDELKAVSENLYYKFLMIDECAKGLNEGLAGNNRIVNNALLDSFLIQSRELLYFFKPTNNSRPDDVVASDYIPNSSEWIAARDKLPLQTEFIEKFCKQVSKLVVHLSYEIINFRSEELNWGNQGKQVYEYLSQAYRLFIKLVPTDSLGPELMRQKEILKSSRDVK